MSPARAFLKWLAIGTLVAVIVIFAQARDQGGVAGLLQVGEISDLRPLIESELGEVPLAAGLGHDGQIFYAIGLDLDGDVVGPLLEEQAGYRYRRILYSALASAGGLLQGHALLWSMIVLMALSVGVSAGSVALLARLSESTDWLALAVVANPGVWLSARLLTGDNIALAFMLLGLMALASRSRLGTVWFSASGLAKELALLTPTALFRRSRWPLTVVPLLVAGAWTLWVTLNVGDGFSSGSNLDWPFFGLIEASRTWPSVAPRDWVYMLVALAAVLAGLVVGVRNRSHWLRWPVLAWSLLAVCSSALVWDYGNNVIRVFAPLIVLVALSIPDNPRQSAPSEVSRSEEAP